MTAPRRPPASPGPGDRQLAAACAVRVAENALGRAQHAVDEHPTAERITERDHWAGELAARRTSTEEN